MCDKCLESKHDICESDIISEYCSLLGYQKTVFILIIAWVFIKIIPIYKEGVGLMTFWNFKYTHKTSVFVYLYKKHHVTWFLIISDRWEIKDTENQHS